MKPKYQIVKDFIIDKIRSGELQYGEKVMSEQELIDILFVSRHTVRKALNDLAVENFIETFKGKGSFVIDVNKPATKVHAGKSKIIAVITAFINDTIFPDIVNGIDEVVSKAGYSIMLFSTRNRIDSERDILLKLKAYDLAGIIVEPTKSALPNPNLIFYKQLKENNVPIVFIHAYYRNLKSDYIIVDDTKAAYKACEYLIQLGHKDIGGVFKSDDLQGHSRYEGFVECMFMHNLHINEDYIMWQATEDEHAIFNNRHLLVDFINRIENCSALLCYNDEFAIELHEELENQSISVPDDLSLVAFDNTKLGDNFKVPITSMDHPKSKLGEMAGIKILEKISNPKMRIKEIFEVDLIVKASAKLKS